MFPFPSLLGIGGVVPTTWDGSKKGANIVLSNGNLTGTVSLSAQYSSVAGVLGKSTGKYYFEVFRNTATGLCQFGIGLWFGSNYVTDGGNGSQLGTVAVYGLGVVGGSVPSSTTCGIAVDLGAKLAWGSQNGVFTGNPAAGTGGTSFSFNAGLIYPVMSLSNTDNATANFGATPFTYTAPAGFGIWGN